MSYSENTLIVDIVTNGSGDDVYYSLSVPGAEILSALKNGGVKLRKITRTERNNAATPAVPQTDDYDYFMLKAVRDIENGSAFAMLFDNGDVYAYDPSESEYPILDGDGSEPGNITLVPSSTSDDAGKVLTVDEAGMPKWAEGGSGGGWLEVHDVDGTLDKTWQEIHDAGFSVCVDADGCYMYIAQTRVIGENYIADYGNGYLGTSGIYSANSASGYPTYISE